VVTFTSRSDLPTRKSISPGNGTSSREFHYTFKADMHTWPLTKTLDKSDLEVSRLASRGGLATGYTSTVKRETRRHLETHD